MKKKVLLLVLVCLFGLYGCSQASASQEPTSTEEQDAEDADEESKDDDVDERNNGEDADEEDKDEIAPQDSELDEQEVDQPSEKPIDITVHYSNDDATAFETEEVQIESLTPEAVLNILVEKGMLTTDIEALSVDTVQVDGKNSLEIDFNNVFSTYVMNMGSTGEYYVIGSVCNTFLDAYDCEQIKITVEGNILETGHTDYPGYMTEFL